MYIGLFCHIHRALLTVAWCWQAVAALSPAARAGVWRYATGRNQPPPKSEGGIGGMKTKFQLVALSSNAIADGALVTAQTCFHELQLPRYSSAQVTARQLARSVDEGLQAPVLKSLFFLCLLQEIWQGADCLRMCQCVLQVPDDSDSFEAAQRRLQMKVQEEMAKATAHGDGLAMQAQMRALFPNSYMCGKVREPCVCASCARVIVCVCLLAVGACGTYTHAWNIRRSVCSNDTHIGTYAVLLWSSRPRRLPQLIFAPRPKNRGRRGGKEQLSKMRLVLLSTRSLAAVGRSHLGGRGLRQECLQRKGLRQECILGCQADARRASDRDASLSAHPGGAGLARWQDDWYASRGF